MIKAKRLKVDVYRLLDEAAEKGISCGWYRAYKHTDTPEEDYIKECMHQEVMNAICEVVDFG